MRRFTIYSHSNKNINKIGGVYKSNKPINAAKKAFNYICRINNEKKCKINELIIRETTRGSKKKLYKYKLERIILKPEKKIKKNGKIIIIKYDTKIKKDIINKKDNIYKKIEKIIEENEKMLDKIDLNEDIKKKDNINKEIKEINKKLKEIRNQKKIKIDYTSISKRKKICCKLPDIGVKKYINGCPPQGIKVKYNLCKN